MNNNHGGNIYEIERTRRVSRDDIADYSANLNPLGPPPGAEKALTRAFTRMSRYPDIAYGELRETIAAYEGVPPSWILPGNGAADVLFQLVRASRPRSAAVVSPAFSEYRQACESILCPVEDIVLSPESGFQPDETLLSRIPEDAQLLFLCTPSNPTGTVCSRDLVEQIAGHCRERGRRLLVDESFLDFREDGGERTAIPLCAAYPNLLVLKSLTKFFAMAGVRIGYAVCPDQTLAAEYHRISPPWMVSAFAEELTADALADVAYQRRSRSFLAEQAASLYEMLSAIPGLRPYPPGANFILFRCETRRDLKEALLERNILIRRCGEFAGLDESWYRVCVSGPEKNAALADALREVLQCPDAAQG